MAEPQRISPRWTEPCIVAAPGPSLTGEVVHRVRMARWLEGWNVIVVSDAYRLLPMADVLYACDNHWWDVHKTCDGFRGEKWSSHEENPKSKEPMINDKRAAADAYGINLVRGEHGDEFSFDPGFIRYGSNSGFQAINLALLFGAKRIVLVGFDMRYVEGKAHFFGSHPNPIPQTKDEGYRGFVKHFDRAAKKLPAHVSIVNATPNSALTSFPMMRLDDALAPIRTDSLLHRDRPEPHAAAG